MWAKPRRLTDGQELMARLDAAGLSLTSGRPSISCPGDLRRELEAVQQRADMLRSVWGVEQPRSPSLHEQISAT